MQPEPDWSAPTTATTAISFAIEDGRITRIYAVRNPAKLSRIDVEATIRR